MKIVMGDEAGAREERQMISEKVCAAVPAGFDVAMGRSANSVGSGAATPRRLGPICAACRAETKSSTLRGSAEPSAAVAVIA